MADEGSTTRQAATNSESGVHRLRDIVVEEVSLVDRAANKRRFLLVKRSSQMANDGKPKDDNSQSGRTGTTAGTGTRGKKPRLKPEVEVDRARPRAIHAAVADEEDEEETEKARRSTESDDEKGENETEKARRSESEDEEDDDVDADKAADENDGDDEDEDGDDEDEEDEPKRGGPASSGKRSPRAGKRAPGDKWPDRTGKATRKAEGDVLMLPVAAKNTVLRALAQALEGLMAIANRVKEAYEPDDEADVSVPDDLTEELEDIGELLEDVGEQLAAPAEKSRDKKPDATKDRSAKADVAKAGRRMAKDRLDRFQKALELLAAVLKELTDERPVPTPSAGSAEKPLGKRTLPDVGELVTSVQELTRVVKQQGEQLGRLQKMRATSNAIPIEGGGRRRDVQDVSWPLDMNRPITRDRVDKAISFYDEE